MRGYLNICSAFWPLAASFCLVFLSFSPCMCNLPRGERAQNAGCAFIFPPFQEFGCSSPGCFACSHQRALFKELHLIFCLLLQLFLGEWLVWTSYSTIAREKVLHGLFWFLKIKTSFMEVSHFKPVSQAVKFTLRSYPF